MAWRRLLCAVVVVAGGCNWQDQLVDGEFTPEQWSVLQGQLALPQAPDGCVLGGYGTDTSRCTPAVQLASELFTDRSLSLNSAVSCETCHDPMHGWIDPRAQNNVSLGPTLWTKRNAMTLWNMGRKEVVGVGHNPFAWDGAYATAGEVVDRAVVKAMQSTHTHVANVIRTNGNYMMLYLAAGGRSMDSDDGVFDNVERAFTAFLAQSQFVTQPTPFDAYLAGNESAISDSAKRGFAVFAGRGTCIDCHSGPLFSDFLTHDTGVPQQGLNVPPVDLGAGNGDFVTGTLREIATTGPYMHDGVFPTLADVIAFYRGGGVAGGYSGTRDPRIQPLDLTDQDALDLEAFLLTLTQADPPPVVGTPVDARPIDAPIAPDASQMCAVQGWQYCNGMCEDVSTDPANCGACGHVCAYPTLTCQQGMCM